MNINQVLLPWNTLPTIKYNPVIFNNNISDNTEPESIDLEYMPEKPKETPEEKKVEEAPKLTIMGDIYGFNGWKFEPIRKETVNTVVRSNPKPVKGSLEFENAFNSYLNKHAENSDTRDILTAIAGLESDFNNKARNPHSSATGYFQFLDTTAKQYGTKVDVNDPESLIELATKHYRNLEKSLKSRKNKIEQSGLTPLQIMYGMWWRPKSMLNYLDKGSDDYVNPSDKMTLLKILNRANG